MKVIILTHDKIIYEGQAISLLASGMNVSFQLLDHHDSMIALLKDGYIQLNQERLISHIKTGIVKIKTGIVKIFIY